MVYVTAPIPVLPGPGAAGQKNPWYLLSDLAAEDFNRIFKLENAPLFYFITWDKPRNLQ
ncbi:hypothetical protein HanHA300_Chr09g0315611 [Helianthus annuus]|nr:hypothetical protein HanHA300_Chr09g0315611 [Helianthus annuus]KAJ0542141.1 hypothetical protein HanHA89_Chr09g0336541 [Helianthus annuus]KAJ0707200.1 hypothetical protein HanLR1_Chr09g0315851 [Helianthus annuus]